MQGTQARKDVVKPQVVQMANIIQIAHRRGPRSKMRRYWQSRLHFKSAVETA